MPQLRAGLARSDDSVKLALLVRAARSGRYSALDEITTCGRTFHRIGALSKLLWIRETKAVRYLLRARAESVRILLVYT